MIDPESQKSQATTDAQALPFKTWAECSKAFKAIRPPVTEAMRDQFIRRLQPAERRRYFAFRLLLDRLVGARATKLAPFEDALFAILSNGEPITELEDRASRKDVENWITQRFERVRSKCEWKTFLSQYEHVWVLYLVLRAWHSAPAFTAAVMQYARCVQQQTSRRQQKASSEAPNIGLQNFVRYLGQKLPEKPALTKGFTELLYSGTALMALSNDLSEEVTEKTAELQALRTKCGELESELNGLQTQNASLLKELAKSKSQIAALTARLDQEQGHFERQKGVNEELRKKMLSDIIGQLRRVCLPRLENIRLFADRADPNKSGIVRLAGEIEEALEEPQG